MNNKYNELSILDKTPDKHFINKILELADRGVEYDIIRSIFYERFLIEPWLNDTNISNKDDFDLRKDNIKGIFRRTQYNDDNKLSLWKKSIIYEDNDITINKPSDFETSSAIGNPIWCYSYNKNYWNEHYILNKETIYMIHSVLLNYPLSYTTVIVSKNGNIKVLNAEHNWLKYNELKTYINSLGKGKEYLKPKINDNKIIKCNYMKTSKNVIRINESQLKQMISESVKNVLSELDWKTYANAARLSRGQGRSTRFANAAEKAFYTKYPQVEYNKGEGTTPKENEITHVKSHDFDFDKMYGGKYYDELDNNMHIDMPIKYNLAYDTDLPSLEWNEEDVDDNGNIIMTHKTLPQYGENEYIVDRNHSRYNIDNINNVSNYRDIEKQNKRANDEMNNYLRGKMKHQKGEGWKLRDKK